MVNFGPLADEIGPVVWDTPANFNGFRILAAHTLRQQGNRIRLINITAKTVKKGLDGSV